MTLVNFDSVQQGLFFDYRCPQCNEQLSGSIDNDLKGDFLAVQTCDNCRIVWILVLTEKEFTCTVKEWKK